MSILLGIFFLLHGMVHLLYAGQVLRFFELRPGLVWPDGAWLFAGWLGEAGTRWLAGISLVLVAIGYAAGALGLFLRQDWWRPSAIGAAIFSMAVFALLWDGKLQEILDKGGVGVLISLAVLVVVLVFKWPG
jgi:hypothetical protein